MFAGVKMWLVTETRFASFKERVECVFMTIFRSFHVQPFNSILLRLQGGPYYFMLYHASRSNRCLTRLGGEDSSHHDVETRKGNLWSRGR
jgi:hypothetical protein